MQFRAVGNRCAVDIDEFSVHLRVSRQSLVARLIEMGFRVLDVDVAKLARERVGKSVYERGAPFRSAPDVVDCSTLTRWLYGMKGIWLPRLAVQQWAYTSENAIGLCGVGVGDLVFRTACFDFFYPNIAYGVGHVGVVVSIDEESVVTDKRKAVKLVHANKCKGVSVISLRRFLRKRDFRGAARIIPNPSAVLSLEFNSSLEIESSEDVFFLLQADIRRRQ